MPNYLRYIIIALAGCLLFFPFLGHVHLFDWDEINFAECAREMIVSKDYLRNQIDFMPFWEKPPFFIWMQALSMKLFGVGEYAARFPNACIGVLTLVTVFYAGKRVMNERLGAIWAMLYAASWLPHFYFKSGIIDPTFNFFIFLSFLQVHFIGFANRKMLHTILAGVFLGIAVLTKGPVALLIAALSLVVYIILSRGWNYLTPARLGIIAVFALLPMALWLGIAVAHYGPSYGKWFLNEFISYQVRLFSTEDADHGGPFFYHFVVLLIGCFPASVFLLQYSHKRISHNAHTHDFTRWMWVLFSVVLILFSIVKTKIVHYSSLCYFPLTYLAAMQLYHLENGTLKLKRIVTILLASIGIVWAIILIALPVVGINKYRIIPYIADPFAVANLRADVPWSYAECIWGVIYLAGIIICALRMKQHFRQSVIILCALQVVIIQVTVLHFTPKIEAYTQRSAITYFSRFAGKDVYVQPLGYKSYANLFYTAKTAAADSNYYSTRQADNVHKGEPIPNEQWLRHGRTDRPVYFICKVQDSARYAGDSALQFTGSANGFVFFTRK
jgi:4-amino-4-deoxy-L-arabinose transferase-like glycosyltransferase